MTDGIVTIPFAGQSLTALEGDPSGRSGLNAFLIGPENCLVEPAIQGVLGERPTIYNPLVLYGPCGSGKSHLVYGLAAAWKARLPHRRIVATTATDFTRELADAIEAQAIDDLRAHYRGAALVVIEDIGRLAGKEAAQEELLHTLDAVLRQGGQCVLTAAAAPAELPHLAPGLRSRLIAGLAVPLSPPGPRTRLAILRRLAQCREIELPDSVAQILAKGLVGTVPELLGAFVHLGVAARANGQPPDAAAAREYLAQRATTGQPQIRQIAVATARHFAITLADLRGSSRRRPVVAARGIAMHLARSLTGQSLQQIGRYFGGRDHTTVIHSCRKTQKLLKTDAATQRAVADLGRKLKTT